MNDVVLQARGLVKEFGGLRAVDSLDFTLRRGELRCVIGPNGAGKSTLFKLLTGQLKPRSEEHTSELQSRLHLVCRLLLEKKKKKKQTEELTIQHISTTDDD